MVQPSSESVALHDQLLRLRGDRTLPPEAGIVIPVNAQKDLTALKRVLADIARYSGAKRIELILVINNYPVDEPPQEIELNRQLGAEVIGISRVEHVGGVAMAARIPGIRIARSSKILLFDADCHIPNPTA